MLAGAMRVLVGVNTVLLLACVQNVYNHFSDMWTFVNSRACADEHIRNEGGILLNTLCSHYTSLSSRISLEALVTTVVHLNYHLIIAMVILANVWLFFPSWLFHQPRTAKLLAT